MAEMKNARHQRHAARYDRDADRHKRGELQAPEPELLRDRLGVCQWFHYQDERSLERAVELLRELGVRHLRTGISWADYHRPQGRRWYERQFAALAEFDLLVSVWHTPPSISAGDACASPPRRLKDFADFIDQIISEFGDGIETLELWNEPNNRLKWDFERFDPQWEKFGQMIAMAGSAAHLRGKRTCLGGMIPVDHHWLELIASYGTLDHIDIVGIHGFPGMWWADAPNWDWHGHWRGWGEKIGYISRYTGGRPVWVTEAGIATWDLAGEREAKFDLQVQMLEKAAAPGRAAAPASAPDTATRVYWYSLIDLDPDRSEIEGFHLDENEYHMGLVSFDGARKPAFTRMQTLLRQALRERPQR